MDTELATSTTTSAYGQNLSLQLSSSVVTSMPGLQKSQNAHFTQFSNIYTSLSFFLTHVDQTVFILFSVIWLLYKNSVAKPWQIHQIYIIKTVFLDIKTLITFSKIITRQHEKLFLAPHFLRHKHIFLVQPSKRSVVLPWGPGASMLYIVMIDSATTALSFK